MKRLEKKIRKNGFEYKLVKRNESVAIYEQKVSDAVKRYEVFEIKRSKEGDRVFGDKVIHYEESELFPSNESFGGVAFCCWDMESANKRFNLITEGIKKRTISKLEGLDTTKGIELLKSL